MTPAVCAASGAAGAALSGAAGAQTRADPLAGCGPRVRFAAEAQVPEQQAAVRERLAASAAGADGRRAIAVEDGGGSFVSSPALPAQCLPGSARSRIASLSASVAAPDGTAYQPSPGLVGRPRIPRKR